MQKLLVLLFLLSASLSFASSGAGPSLPTTCSAGDFFTVDGPLDFTCVGNNTWRQNGGVIIAARKGVSLAVGNTDFPVSLPSIKWVPRKVLITGASTSLAGSPARLGIWTGAGATGVNVIAASPLTTLTTAAVFGEVNTAATSTATVAQVFIRCTVAHSSAATVDVYFYGEILP